MPRYTEHVSKIKSWQHPIARHRWWDNSKINLNTVVIALGPSSPLNVENTEALTTQTQPRPFSGTVLGGHFKARKSTAHNWVGVIYRGRWRSCKYSILQIDDDVTTKKMSKNLSGGRVPWDRLGYSNVSYSWHPGAGHRVFHKGLAKLGPMFWFTPCTLRIWHQRLLSATVWFEFEVFSCLVRQWGQCVLRILQKTVG